MSVDPNLFYSLIEQLITQPSAPEPNAAIAGVIDACATQRPHPDWAALRAIDYAADVPVLRTWLDRVFREEPPDFPLRALYFELCHPVHDIDEEARTAQLDGLQALKERLMSATTDAERDAAMADAVAVLSMEVGRTTTDLSVAGYAAFEAEDDGFEWLESDRYSPDAYASAPALAQLYDVAYPAGLGNSDEGEVLANDAEWPVSLAYAVVLRAALEGYTLPSHVSDATRVGITMGWSGGETFRLGELAANGFVPAERPLA